MKKTPLFVAIVPFALLASDPLRDQDKPISYLLVDASRLDRALPAVPFDSWLESVVGEDSRIDWDLIECRGSSLGTSSGWSGATGSANAAPRARRHGKESRRAAEAKPAMPLCIELDARLPECGSVKLSMIVGSADRGIHLEAVRVLATIEGIGPTVRFRRLHELPVRLAQARDQERRLRALPARPIDPAEAIHYVKRLRARDLDSKLPKTKFASWFRRLAGSAEPVMWKLDVCDPMAPRRTLKGCADEWLCVHARFENELDAVAVAVKVGTYRRGIFADPMVYSTRHFVKTGRNFGIHRPELHEILADLEGLEF